MLNMHRCVVAPGLAVALLAFPPAIPGLRQAPAGDQAQAQDPAAQIDAITARWDTAEQDFYAKYKEAKTNDERREVMKSRPQVREYLDQVVALAEKIPETEGAARAWMWVLEHVGAVQDDELAQVAVDTLVRDHLDSPAVAGLPMAIYGLSRSLGAEKAEALLRDLMAQSAEGALKVNATYALALSLDSDKLDPDSERGKEVRKLMETVAHADPAVQDSRERSLAAVAEGWLFAKDRLQVGMVVPDIEANDVDGKPLKLSDYRGKVVLLDFWGNW